MKKGYYHDSQDFIKTLHGLPLLHRALYRELIDLCAIHGSIPEDFSGLVGEIGATDAHYETIRRVLGAFFRLDDGFYYLDWLDEQNAITAAIVGGKFHIDWKKVKAKAKEVAVIPVELPSGINPKLWAAFIDNRAALKKPMTERAQNLMIKKMKHLLHGGHKVNQLLENSIRNGWLDLYPEQGQQQSNHGGFSGGRVYESGDMIGGL